MEPTTESGVLQRLSNDLAAAVERAGNSIVRVEGRRSNPASGVVWSSDGLVVTAHHVLERDENIKVVTAAGQEFTATVAGRDPGADLALLRVPTTDLVPLTTVPAAEAKVGHLALAVARPLSLAATLGVVSTVSGPWRTWRGGQIERLIQTDAPFYPGFSGGALIDPAGRLYGLISSQLGRGLNLALPADLIGGLVNSLSTHGRVRRGYLGIGSQPVALPAGMRGSLGLTQETGLLVVTVEPNGPADRAGLLLGDILVEIGGAAVSGIDDLQAQLTGDRIGVATPATLVRGGQLVHTSITVGERARAAE
jgi:S1-C subfamily serine protease